MWLPHFPCTCDKKAPQTRVLWLSNSQRPAYPPPFPAPKQLRAHGQEVDSREEKREPMPPSMAAPEGWGQIQRKWSIQVCTQRRMMLSPDELTL